MAEPAFDYSKIRRDGDLDLTRLAVPNSTRTDAILRAATDSFCAPRRRSPQEITVFAQLVRPLMPKASKETLRWMSAVLSAYEFAPSETCRILANQSISIAAPVLATAAKLSINDQIAIAKLKSEEHRVLLSQRRNISAAVITEILDKGEAEPTRHLMRNKPKAMTADHARKAMTIIAQNMGTQVELDQDQPAMTEPANNMSQEQARELQSTRSDLAARSDTMERARKELLALAARGNRRLSPQKAKELSADTFSSNSNLLDEAAVSIASDGGLQASGSIPTPALNSTETSSDPANSILEAARSLDQNNLQRALEQSLNLSPLKINELMSDRSLESLCVALRAINCGAGTAKRILTAVHMVAIRDMRMIKRLEDAFAALDPNDCAKALAMWQADNPLNITRPAPTLNTHSVNDMGIRGGFDRGTQAMPTASSGSRSTSASHSNRRDLNGLTGEANLVGDGYALPRGPYGQDATRRAVMPEFLTIGRN